MEDRFGLSIVIGTVIGGAMSGLSKVGDALNGMDTTISRLNQKKLDLMANDAGVRKISSQISSLAGEISKLQTRSKQLKIKLQSTESKEEAQALAHEVREVDREIRRLNSRRMDLDEQLRDARGEAIRVDKSIAKIGKTIDAVNKSKLTIEANAIRRDKFKASIVETAALGASIAIPIKASIDFESAMADVKKVVSFDAAGEVRAFGQEILTLSKTIPIAADSLAAITASGGQLGLPKEQLMGFTTIAAKMGTAFDMVPKAAGESIAKMMNVYGLGLKEVVSLGDAINYLSDNTAAKADDIVNVLSRVGGTAKTFGLSAVQASALGDAFLALGKPAEVAATATNAILVKLQTADKQGRRFQEALAQIGMDSGTLKQSIQSDAQGALLGFLETLQGVERSERMGVLLDMFGAEYSDDVSLLVEGLDNYRKAIDATAESNRYAGAMQREFKARSATTANSLQILRNNITAIGINLGTLFLPVINKVVGAISSVSDVIGGFVERNQILSTIIGGVIGGVIVATVTVSAFGYAWTFVSNGIHKSLLVFQALRSALLLSNMSKGVAILRSKLLAFWQGAVAAKTRLMTLWTSRSAIAQNTAAIASKAWAAGMLVANSAMTLLRSGVRLLMGSTGIGLILVAAGLIYQYWLPVKEFFIGLWSRIKGAFIDALGFIQSALGFSPLGLIIESWGSVFEWFAHKLDWLGGAVGQIQDIGETIAGFIGFGDEDDEQEGKRPSPDNSIRRTRGVFAATAIGTTVAMAQPDSLLSRQSIQQPHILQVADTPQRLQAHQVVQPDIKIPPLPHGQSDHISTNVTNTTPSSRSSESHTHHYTINIYAQTSDPTDIAKAVKDTLKQLESTRVNTTFSDEDI